MFFSHNAGTMMYLIFSVTFCLLIIGNGKFSFESSTLPVLCWGFKMVGLFVFVGFFVSLVGFLVGCFVFSLDEGGNLPSKLESQKFNSWNRD